MADCLNSPPEKIFLDVGFCANMKLCKTSARPLTSHVMSREKKSVARCFLFRLQVPRQLTAVEEDGKVWMKCKKKTKHGGTCEQNKVEKTSWTVDWRDSSVSQAEPGQSHGDFSFLFFLKLKACERPQKIHCEAAPFYFAGRLVGKSVCSDTISRPATETAFLFALAQI